mgnify:FL=1
MRARRVKKVLRAQITSAFEGPNSHRRSSMLEGLLPKSSGNPKTQPVSLMPPTLNGWQSVSSTEQSEAGA